MDMCADFRESEKTPNWMNVFEETPGDIDS